MQTRVNPNRMQLLRLRSRLKTAERGHKLLKDKHDELMRRFLELVWESRDLRVKVEAQLEKVSTSMVMATATASPAVIEEALLFPKQKLDVHVREDALVSVQDSPYQVTRTRPDGALVVAVDGAAAEGEDVGVTECLCRTLPHTTQGMRLQRPPVRRS
jgi:V/A-type H+-transporting ATPase subunit D